jgi:hypothetical protein
VTLSRRQMRSMFQDVREEYGLDIEEMRAAVVKSGIGEKSISDFTLVDICDLHQACRDIVTERTPASSSEAGAAVAEGFAALAVGIQGLFRGFNDRVAEGAQK